MPVVCSAQTDAAEIALSFDDGPKKNYTSAVLRVLKTNNVKAAFFCIGSRIAGSESLFAQVHEEGHLIGNHSYSHHFWFDLFSAKKMLSDLRMMSLTMENEIGLRPRLFRPPYGVMNPNLKKAILRGNYIPVGWSVRSMDTVVKDEKKLLKRMTAALRPGAIFLFHDTSRVTLAILPEFIRYATRQGYKIVRLDKLLNLKAYV